MTPRRWPFFYGWVIVGVAFVGSGIGSGAAIWGPSVLLLPMTEDMEWSRAQFFSAFLVRELIAGFSAPFIGPLYDTKHGPRLLMGAGALILGASTALVSVVGELWQFVLLFGVGGGLAELGSGFYISQTLVPKWFMRHRGRALGVAIMGVGLGALVFPGVISTLIGSVGWRGAWVWFGVGIGSIGFVLSLFVRTRPEDVGLLPDGGLATEDVRRTPSRTMVIEPLLTRREAIRTPAFWLLLVSFSLVGLGITGFQTNWHPFLVETGFGPVEASFGIAIYGLVSGIVRPGWGLLGERFPPRYLMAGAATATAVLILVFLNVRGFEALIVVMFIAGAVMGGYLVLRALLTANYFGREYLGSVDSFMRPFMTGTGAMGPLIFGALYDLRGGYGFVFVAAAIAWGIAGLIVLPAKPPRTANGLPPWPAPVKTGTASDESGKDAER